MTLAPPSLSQALCTQDTQSQAHPSHSFTPSQSTKPTPSQSSILAPNSLSQQSANSTQTKMTGKSKQETFKILEIPFKPTATEQGQISSKTQSSTKVKTSKIKNQEPKINVTKKSAPSHKITDFVKPTKPVSTRVTRSKPASASLARHTAVMSSPSQRISAIKYEDDDEMEIIESSQPDSQEDPSRTASKSLPGLSLKRNSQYSKSRIHYHSQEDLPTSPKQTSTQSKNIISSPFSLAASDSPKNKGESVKMHVCITSYVL